MSVQDSDGAWRRYYYADTPTTYSAHLSCWLAEFGVHIADEAIVDGKVDVTRLKPIARLGYGDYAVIDEVFTLPRGGVGRGAPQ